MIRTHDQVCEMVQNLEVPVCLKLADCYLSLAEPKFKEAEEVCTRVLDKNLGLLAAEVDSPDTFGVLDPQK